MNLEDTWENCLKMWKWIVGQGDKSNVDDLKNQWLQENGFSLSEFRNNCFFCDRIKGNSCQACPGRLVDGEFRCNHTDYNYYNKPIEFYEKIKELNKIRKAGKDMGIKEAYKVMQAECGIERGDKVKVVRKFSNNELGTNAASWDGYREKAKMQGREFIVDEICTRYIYLVGGSTEYPLRVFQFPFFALELVEKAKKPEPEKMVDVDGKKISLSTVQEALRNHIG